MEKVIGNGSWRKREGVEEEEEQLEKDLVVKIEKEEKHEQKVEKVVMVVMLVTK